MRKFIVLITLLVITGAAFAQTRQVQGRVTDDSSAALAGATVQLRGSRNSTTTGSNGEFSLGVPGSGRVTLVISYTGKRSATVEVSGSDAGTIVLEAEVGALDDVVVLGYTTARRRDVLASVASIGAKDLKDIPINSAAEALNGRLAGVTATTAEGSPDADIRIRVRGGMSITGDNSPLYVIDGVQMENALNFISPQDIKTIDVLKDAAATAIYGARGANGVIVITTKGGRTGKPRLTYNGFVGVKFLANKLDLFDPYEFVLYQYERSRASSADSATFARNFGTTWDTLQNYKNVAAVDWQEEMMGRTGVQSTHSLGVEGGTKKLTYSGSYTYNMENAIVRNSTYRRHIAGLRLDYKLLKSLKLGGSFRYTHQDVEGAGVSDDRGSAYNRLRNAVKYRPFLSEDQDLDDNDPLADGNVGNGLNLINPILLTDAEYRNKVSNAMNTTAYLQYTIAKGLMFKSTFGYIKTRRHDLQFYDSIAPFSVINGAANPVARLDTTKQETFTNNNVLTYNWNSDNRKHRFDVLLGEETYDLRSSSRFNQFRDYPNFISPEEAFNNTGQAAAFAGFPSGRRSRYTSLSFFGRLGYAFADRYLASFNIRYDGASKFSPERRWGTFPSASLAWRIKEEKFLRSAKWLDDLKLRASFGTIGNNRIDDYLYITNFNNDGRYYYGIGNEIQYALYSSSLVNQGLQWESTESRNLGFDLSMFKQRFSLTLDVYENRSKDLLLNVPVASTFGYSTQIQNVGRTTNTGVELQLNAAVLRNPSGFNWNSSFNISFNKNRIEALGPNQDFFFAAPAWGVSGQPADYIQKIGSPVGSIWGLVTDGFYTTADFDYNAATQQYILKSNVPTNTAIIGVVQPGSIKFKDLNNDGKIDLDNDRQIIGNPQPKFTGGFNNTFNYKRWDATLFINFSYGNKVYNANRIEFTNAYSTNSNMLQEMGDRWRIIDETGKTLQWTSGNNAFGVSPAELNAANANAQLWQPLRTSGAFYPHSWAIEDGSFIRINNLTVGYTIPASRLLRLKMSQLRFYVTANNLAVFTNYSGFDPEVSVRNNPLTPGLDYSSYPKSRTFIFGINAAF